MGKRSRFLGEVVLPLQSDVATKQIGGWLPLRGREGKDDDEAQGLLSVSMNLIKVANATMMAEAVSGGDHSVGLSLPSSSSCGVLSSRTTESREMKREDYGVSNHSFVILPLCAYTAFFFYFFFPCISLQKANSYARMVDENEYGMQTILHSHRQSIVI